MKQAIILLVVAALTMISCRHESVDDRVAREAREYTEKYCPTPDNNGTRLDSMVYDRASRTLINYCSVTGPADDAKVMADNERNIIDALTMEVRNDPKTKGYRNEKIAIRYILYSKANPKTIWIDTTVK